MIRAHDLFRPNGLKLLLALTLIVPVFFVITLASGFPYSDMLLLAAITVVISYGAACVIDDAIQSRTTKIAIASVAALISIVLGYIFTQTMTMVCDPVHDPGGVVCDPVHIPTTTPAVIATTGPTTTTPIIFDPVHVPTTTPAVIATTGPTTTTPMIFDPVHEPDSCSQACYDTFSSTAHTSDLVTQKLEECLRNCGR
jgi:hypothetical protein